jgi:mannose-6-phosphate isomerase-like protein (cupin superfamily)
MLLKYGLTGVLMLFFTATANADVTFKYISAADAKAMVEAPVNGKGPGNIADGPDFKLTLSERNKPGKVEQHADWNDELIIQEGDVLLNYGGTSVNAKETGPGETLGDSISGGKSVLMHAGDMVVIPAGTPHQMLIQTPTMRYIVFKTRKDH